MIPELPNIIETPHHFFFGSVDLISAIGDNSQTLVKPLGNGLVKVTKTFVAKSYQYKDDNSLMNLNE